MARAPWSLTLGFVLGIAAMGCKRKPSAAAGAAEEKPTAVVTAVPLPLEPPPGPLRVPNSGFSCALDDLLAAKCRRCHTVPPRHDAPFPLLTWDDTRGMIGDRVRYLVMASVTKSGYMPYTIPANPPVQPLTDQEKKTIADWVDAGGPRGECPAGPEPTARAPAPRRGPQQNLPPSAPAASARPR